MVIVMTKLKKKLLENEELVLKGKVNWETLIFPILGILATYFVTIIGEIKIDDLGEDLFVLIWWLFILIWFLYRLALIKSIWLILTDKRLIGQCGKFSSEKVECPINRIDSVTVKNGLFGHCKLTIHTNGAKYEFDDIVNPEKIKKAIMDQII